MMSRMDVKRFFDILASEEEAIQAEAANQILGAIALIQLTGYPYERELYGELVSCTVSLHKLAERSKYRENLPRQIAKHSSDMAPLRELGFHGLDALVKSPRPLTYEEAFSLITYVMLASNGALYAELAPGIKG